MISRARKILRVCGHTLVVEGSGAKVRYHCPHCDVDLVNGVKRPVTSWHPGSGSADGKCEREVPIGARHT